jgi:AraC family transcriptional activator of pobA
VHLREHRGLAFYAAALGCTERTLTRLARARLGASPLALINRRLALEAQRLLRYTNASVAQVAHELGFADPSYFSRFYLRQTGRRPQAERA